MKAGVEGVEPAFTHPLLQPATVQCDRGVWIQGQIAPYIILRHALWSTLVTDVSGGYQGCDFLRHLCETVGKSVQRHEW